MVLQFMPGAPGIVDRYHLSSIHRTGFHAGERMRMLFIIAFFLLGCGQDKQDFTVDLNGAHVLWEGNVLDSEYADSFNETVQCLQENFGIIPQRTSYKLVIVDDIFICGGYENVNGCFTGYTNTTTVRKFMSHMITSDIVKHETIHFSANVGNEAHDTTILTLCSPHIPR